VASEGVQVGCEREAITFALLEAYNKGDGSNTLLQSLYTLRSEAVLIDSLLIFIHYDRM
jgi:hypothetical protein